MHARYRPPGNGFRPNSVGPPHGMHNPEFRNFNYGFGHGPPMSYAPGPPLPPPPPPPPQPQQQPPHKSDIFMEAGRLAAEYLVSEGLLPPDVLPGKWQNGNMNNQMVNFQEFRPQDWENQQMPLEGRASVHARIGNVVPDGVTGRRRFPDGFNQNRQRNPMRGRKKMGSFRGPGDWGRDNGRSGSWLDKSRFDMEDEFLSGNTEEQQVSSDVSGGALKTDNGRSGSWFDKSRFDMEDEFLSGNTEEQQVSSDVSGGALKTISKELQSKSDNAGELETEVKNYELPDDMGSKASSSSNGKEPLPETDREFCKVSDDSKFMNLDKGEVKDDITNEEMEKQGTVEAFDMQHSLEEGDIITDNSIDLQSCSFAKLPAEECSLLTCEDSKADGVAASDAGNLHDIAPAEGAEVPKEEDVVEGSSSVTLTKDFTSGKLTNQTQDSKCFDSDIARSPSAPSLEDAVDLNPASVEREICTTPDKSLIQEESGQGLSGFGRCNSVVKDRGEKRAVENDNEWEGTKKPRGSSSMAANADEFFQLHFGVKPSDMHEGLSPDKAVVNDVDQERLVDVALFPKEIVDLDIELIEDKLPSPSSFKICDLNLTESSDMTVSHDREPIPGLPSTSESQKEVIMDIDMSTSNSCNRSDNYDSHSSDAKEVAVLNVTNESSTEDNAFDISERKTENVYSGMESFPNRTESTGQLHDVQDGYSLMISDFLGTDYSNCSSVPEDITSLHSEMGLHHSGGILGDDDQLYLSLGEIPISFLGGWEQPPEYGKPF